MYIIYDRIPILLGDYIFSNTNNNFMALVRERTHVILLAKIIPRYFTLFTNGMCPSVCGKHPHSGFSPRGKASNHALHSGRMFEAAVRGATSRLHPTAGDFHRQGGIPPKLHQSDNSDHTKRQFELVTRLGQSSISNYATSSAVTGRAWSV
jgi:hypothetical protein